MGLFQKNVARSNGDYGFIFSNHETGEEVILSEIKAIKNRHRGIYIGGSYNVTLSDSVISDNTRYGIELRWTDNLLIKNTLIRGHTEATRLLVKAPYFSQPCDSSNWFVPAIGLLLPTQIWSWNKNDNIGATLFNVHFTDFDHSDECEPSIPISFSDEKRNNHFDYVTMFQNVTIDGKKLMDAPSSDQEGTRDVIIHDVDGSSDPSGQASQPGMFISSVKWLKDFASGSCTAYNNGISYCPNNCFRSFTFLVDQSVSENIDLVVTKQDTGTQVIVPYVSYQYEEDSHLKHFYDNYRFFSVALPSGLYKMTFMKDLKPVWPTYVLQRWDGIPSCEGFVSSENITLEEPSFECDELILNGDMELGTSNWMHRNDRSVDSGELLVVEGKGRNNSSALKLINRNSGYSGIGQDLDTRCFHQNLNELYEIKMYFRLENNTEPFICDPFTSEWETRCPSITFRQQKLVDEIVETQYMHNKATIVVPNDLEDLNLLHGVVKVDESINILDRVFMYLEFAHQDFDMIVDDVSVKKITSINVCQGEDLVRNGKFDGNSMFWTRYGNTYLDIVEDYPGGKNLKVSNREGDWYGVIQDLFIDMKCFQEKQRFLVTGAY